MTARDPLHVQFHLPDAVAAHHLDLMIARAGGDPDAWLAGLIETHRLDAMAQAPKRLADLADFVAASRPPGPLPVVPDRPAARGRKRPTRAAQPDSAWRERDR